MPIKTDDSLNRHYLANYFRDSLKHLDDDRKIESYSMYYFQPHDNWLADTKTYLKKWSAVMNEQQAQKWIEFINQYDFTDFVQAYHRLAQAKFDTYWGTIRKASLLDDWYPGMTTTYDDLAKYQALTFQMENQLLTIWHGSEEDAND